MDILFVSGLYSKNITHLINRCKCGYSIQNACNVFQWGVVEGLEENEASYKVLSFPFLPCYPIGFKDIYTKKDTLVWENNIIGESSKYCTIVGVKPISIYYGLKNKIKDWLKNTSTIANKVVLVYAPESYVLSAVIKVKKIYPQLIICIIVTDLVDDMLNFSSNKFLLKRIQCDFESRSMKKLYKSVDKFVLLTKYMCEKIPQAKNKNIIIEGIYNVPTRATLKQEITGKSLLYTGSLELFSGIKDLIQAFTKTTNSNYKLIICGQGFLESYIKSAALKDKRIIYKGIVMREEAISLQKSCTALINPRKPNGAITKYSFPSKTIEYLSSGTPMIGYKLEGIPDDYYNYYFTIDDLSIESLTQKIEYVLDLDKETLLAMALNAQKYIVQKKNAYIQMKRILTFLCE